VLLTWDFPRCEYPVLSYSLLRPRLTLPTTQALFATPLFNWDEDNLPVIKQSFKYYWVIAIPLTLLILMIWVAAMLLPWARWSAQFLWKIERSDIEAASGKRLKEE
jgi:hypothetical protein